MQNTMDEKNDSGKPPIKEITIKFEKNGFRTFHIPESIQSNILILELQNVIYHLFLKASKEMEKEKNE